MIADELHISPADDERAAVVEEIGRGADVFEKQARVSQLHLRRLGGARRAALQRDVRARDDAAQGAPNHKAPVEHPAALPTDHGGCLAVQGRQSDRRGAVAPAGLDASEERFVTGGSVFLGESRSDAACRRNGGQQKEAQKRARPEGREEAEHWRDV